MGTKEDKLINFHYEKFSDVDNHVNKFINIVRAKIDLALKNQHNRELLVKTLKEIKGML